jgi:predicted RNA binding protein YcfA (HicA-like mRNA interferase family)
VQRGDASRSDLKRLAARHGWRLERTRGGHWRLVAPSGRTVVASFTPSASDMHILAGQMRRAERHAEAAR